MTVIESHTGIFPTDNGKTPQSDECYCCGRITKPGCLMFLMDKDTREVVNPHLPYDADATMRAVPIGPECRKAIAGIERYAVDAKLNPLACSTCGKVKQLHSYGDARLCGTCISREERRINCKEMWGRGRRGY